MRCSCARNRLAALAVLPILLSCASAPPAPGSPEPFRLEGLLNVEGPDPFNRTLTLTDADGIGWRLDPGRLERELSLLGGHEMRLYCESLSGRSPGAVAVVRYELLAVDGYEPLYGVVRAIPGAVQIDVDGGSVHLHGPLSGALARFDGHAVWVWGERGHRGTMTLEGYVVMGPASIGPSDH